jgi:hypothetical protein
MWSIDQLRIVLPPGFEGRAERLGRLLAEELADLPVPAGLGRLDLARLALPAVEIDPRLGDREIAGRIARQIVQQVAGSTGSSDSSTRRSPQGARTARAPQEG